MTVRWNPNFEREMKREVVRNLAPKYAAAVRNVRCPDHPDFALTVKTDGDEGWLIGKCCDKGEALALEAIRKVNS